ncbi:ATP-grasp fold amidoligase family protein [uncultured Robinsoniella sp.]|uniref:ATP-grasp fold amidoligase family protein n=1 Tax=uncultured Robinsoniella sp. TaxID=904190 RepID=UPI00374EE66C
MDKKKIMIDLKYAMRFLPDEFYVKLYYRLRVKRKLNLKNPETYNEKLQWLKFNDRDPFYSIIVDKYEVRKVIAREIGEKYLIPLVGVWDSFEQIDFSKLPHKFVLKCNHDSGGFVICVDKEKFNIENAKKIIESSMKRNFYYVGREWQYKNIEPKIICEEFIGENDIPPTDYKISCFNGIVDNVMICYGRETGTTKYYFFDKNWKLLRYNYWGKNAATNFTTPKPENMDEMFELAEKLSKEYYFARIDLYNVNGKVYFGEITLCPNSGFDGNILSETDSLLGKKLRLPMIDYK